MEKISAFTTENGIEAVKLTDIPKLNIFKTFDCGQCFRFDPVSIFGGKYEFGGVAFGKYVVFSQNCDTELTIYGSTVEEYEKIWRPFLALDVDYNKINGDICSAVSSSDMKAAVEYGDGIRILRQDGWECVCSFIISQNNNIPRIKKIVSSMSEKYGEKKSFAGKDYYSFPTPRRLFDAGEEEIFALKTGFRAKYIYDACRLILSGDVDLNYIRNENDFQKCLEYLCKIKGIGPKVASCALLFGFEKTEAFPIDVWMKRALAKYFPSGIDLNALGKNAGIAQQYLFYYEKYRQDT